MISLPNCVTNRCVRSRGFNFKRVDIVLLQRPDEEIRMSSRDRVVLPALEQLFQGIGAGRIEEPVRCFMSVEPGFDHGFVDKTFDGFGYIVLTHPFFVHDCDRVIQCERSTENRHATQYKPFDLREMIVAPIQRGPERPMSWVCRAPTELEQVKSGTETCRGVLKAKHRRPRRGEFDCKRYSIELAANLGYQRRVIVAKLEIGSTRTGSFHEQLNGRI